MRLLLVIVALLAVVCWAVPVEKRQAENSQSFNEAVQAYLKLSPDRQVVYREYFKDENRSEEETMRRAAQMHLKDPDIYAIYKIIFNGIIRELKDEDLKEFMQYYIDRTAEVKNTSDKEWDSYKEDVREEYEKLGKAAKKELHEKYQKTEEFLEEDDDEE